MHVSMRSYAGTEQPVHLFFQSSQFQLNLMVPFKPTGPLAIGYAIKTIYYTVDGGEGGYRQP